MSRNLEKLCESGSLEEIERVANGDEYQLNKCLFFGCKYNRRDIVHFAVRNGAYMFNDALYFACRFGGREMVNMMIELGADDWNTGFRGACESGNREIVHLMIAKCVTKYGYRDGFMYACYNGYKDIVEDIMLNFDTKNMLWLYYGVCKHRWVDLILKVGVYIKLSEHLHDCHDMFNILDVREVNVTIIDMNIKLFDMNLFLN